MTTYNFSALSNGQAISFNPNGDVLNFDQTAISAGNLAADLQSSDTKITVLSGTDAGKSITLLSTMPPQLATSNVHFANGSALLFGDNSPGTAGDDAANTLSGTSGADLIKDDELLGDQEWCPLEERVRAVAAAIPESVRYAPNVTGPVDGLLRRAERAVELGASALMVNAFAQGLDTLRALREADLGVPLFAHRVGAAFWIRGPLGVAGTVVVELTRLCGADYVQVGSFSGRVFEGEDQVRAQVAACHRPLGGAHPATAVLGGGVGLENAAEHVRRAGADSRLMVLLGSRAYAYPGGVEEGVRAAVEAVRT